MTHSLDERDSPSKFRVSTPALLYKALPQSNPGLFIYLFYYYYYYFFFFSSFPHGVFIVRKLTVISIAPIQYCLAHLNELISVV